MKTKKTIWSLSISLILILAMFFGLGLSLQSNRLVNANEDEHITFSVTVNDEQDIVIEPTYNGNLVIKYTVTEATGVDALQLRLGYDHDAFTLTSVVTNDSTALDAATKGQENYLENVVYDNVDAEGATFVLNANDDDVLLITATFTLNNPTPATAYTFGLYNVNDAGELDIAYSTAWRIEKQDEASSYHEPVEIRLTEATVYVRGEYEFTLTGGEKFYDGVAAANNEITVNDSNNQNRPTLTFVWFVENGYDYYTKLDSNPSEVGTYYVVLQYAATNYYDAYCGYTSLGNNQYSLTDVEDHVAVYKIKQKAITITATAQSADYTGIEPTVNQNAYTVSDNIEVSGVVITKQAGVNAGDYTLTPSLENNNYNISFVNGTFTINPKAITIKIDDKSSKYGAPLAELTWALKSGSSLAGNDTLAGLHVELSTTATSSSSVGTYPITGEYSNNNYAVK